MKTRAISAVLLSCLSVTCLAKAPNPLCAGVTGSNFTTGDGSAGNPYLICNTLQMGQIGTNTTFLTKSFKLGADLNFNGLTFQMLGSQVNIFQGTFNGDNYTLSSINIPAGGNYVAIFPHTRGATISNLLVDGVSITSSSLGSPVGGLIALGESTTVSNVKLRNLNMIGPDYSGGLIGTAQGSNISKSLVQGVIRQTFGTDAGGGVIGYANNSQISSCASHVTILQRDPLSFGVSDIGALIGFGTNSVVNNCYADGNIDYSNVTDIYPSMLAHYFGGIYGAGDGILNNVFYAGKFIALDSAKAEHVGGIAGGFAGSVNSAFWDTMVSGTSQSAVGVGMTTCLMQQRSFWLAQGFDPTIWVLADGAYPKLVSEN